ncbi:MAG: hypothetical protein IIZ47_04175 [Erysipelotrichaceae bacterium]|nr:hypothetical protein [Erysipelotrichaceae bacterium]
MKLQVAGIFGEHMVFQRNEEILIWGRSAADDMISVEFNGRKTVVPTVNGEWKASLPAMEAASGLEMTISSARTGESLYFKDVAIGEVWLAGGQSNMEFLMKYDVDAEEMKATPDDLDLRFFCVPQSPFLGFLEKEPVPEHGFWRRWEGPAHKIRFSAVGAYMGKILREELKVPVAIIGCNWGGTPASAWTAMEDLKDNEKLSPVFEEYERNCAQIDWRKYFETSERPMPIPTKEQLDFENRFMMGEDMSEFFKNMANMPRPDISVWSTYPIAPRSATRPAGVYETMLKKVAPYPIRGFLWYQGEDDDARGWADFYDESMITMITSWRKLWGKELPFFQVELPGFRGIGMTGAKKYAEIRHLQHRVTKELKDVHDICILDCGEEFNIHPRRKRKVGQRLGRMVMKYVYGDKHYVADAPEAIAVNRDRATITITFENTADGLHVEGDLTKQLILKAGETVLNYEAQVLGDRLVLTGDFADIPEIEIRYCEENWCEAALFNSEDNPVYGFTCRV